MSWKPIIDNMECGGCSCAAVYGKDGSLWAQSDGQHSLQNITSSQIKDVCSIMEGDAKERKSFIKLGAVKFMVLSVYDNYAVFKQTDCEDKAMLCCGLSQKAVVIGTRVPSAGNERLVVSVVNNMQQHLLSNST